MKLLFLFIIFFLLIIGFLPNTASAAPTPTPCPKDSKSIECTFGAIAPPPAIQTLIGKDTTGAAGISKFLSNFVTLIFSISTVVLLFMVLWGAFDWIISEGDKEKLANAQKKLLNAFIGIIILAIAFAVMSVLGTFTGFTFFKKSDVTDVERRRDGSYDWVECHGIRIAQMRDGSKITDPVAACEEYDAAIIRP